MKSVEVTNIVKKSLVKLVVIDKVTNKVRVQGSGIVVNDEGFIITANHVVQLALNDKSKFIWAIPYSGGGAKQYTYAFGGISFQIKDQKQILPMNIDLAVLVPIEKIDIPAIKLSEEIPLEGTETIMAGFPSDLKTPLDFSDNINEDVVGGQKNVLQIREFANSIIPWIMVKHGIIGGVFHIVTPNMSTELLGETVTFPLKAAEYWVDNTYAPGASGGPIVDMDGKLLGIITERGLTYESDYTETITFPVPSGTVRVLSHKLISWSLEEIKKRWNSKT